MEQVIESRIGQETNARMAAYMTAMEQDNSTFNMMDDVAQDEFQDGFNDQVEQVGGAQVDEVGNNYNSEEVDVYSELSIASPISYIIHWD